MKIIKDRGKSFSTEYSTDECETIFSTTMRINYERIPIDTSKIVPISILKTMSSEEFKEFKKRQNEERKKNYTKESVIIDCSFRNGKIISFEFPKDEMAYIGQYGITVTKDGKYLFLQVWDEGLYCYETETGKQVWKSPIKKVKKVFSCGNVIIAQREDIGIDILSLSNGEKIKRISCIPFNISYFLVWQLNECYFIYGPKHGEYSVVRFSDLKEVYKFNIGSEIPKMVTYTKGKIIFECDREKYIIPFDLG